MWAWFIQETSVLRRHEKHSDRVDLLLPQDTVQPPCLLTVPSRTSQVHFKSNPPNLVFKATAKIHLCYLFIAK